MMGRRPKRSDKTPRTGENTNCISAKTVPKILNHFAAEGVSPPRKLSTSFGRTGAINPSASMSSVTVIKMKTTAALRGFMEGLLTSVRTCRLYARRRSL